MWAQAKPLRSISARIGRWSEVLIGSCSDTTHLEMEESMCDGPRKWSVMDSEPMFLTLVCVSGLRGTGLGDSSFDLLPSGKLAFPNVNAPTMIAFETFLYLNVSSLNILLLHLKAFCYYRCYCLLRIHIVQINLRLRERPRLPSYFSIYVCYVLNPYVLETTSSYHACILLYA